MRTLCIRKSLIITLCLLLCSCAGEFTPDDYLEQALELAGDNRSELEAVLDHYKDEPEKLRAARYLIENMPGHYSYRP